MALDHGVSVLGVVIRLPAEAIVPLSIAAIALAVIVLAGNAALAWKERNPAGARAFGYGLAVLASAGALFFAARVVPPTQANDRVHEGIRLVSLFDPILSAFCAAVAGVAWRFAGKRWIGGVLAIGIAGALSAKPFVAPLVRTWNGVPHTFLPTSETHLFFLLSGLALAVVALLLIAIPARTAPLPPARVR